MKVKRMVFLFFYFLVLNLKGEIKKVENVYLIYNDNNLWGGASLGCTHQDKPNYQIMKILNIEGINLNKIKEARLQIFFGTVDYSEPRTGFTEDMVIKINGNEIKIPLITLEKIVGAYKGSYPPYQWIDFIIPISYLKNGENKIIIHKGENSKDDFIYIGIDNSVQKGTSFLSLDGGKTWTNEKLNLVNATGEYMIRLVLYEDKEEKEIEIVKDIIKKDDQGLVQFIEYDGQSLYLEFEKGKISTFSNIRIEGIRGEIIWKDTNGKEIGKGSVLKIERDLPFSLVINNPEFTTDLIRIKYFAGYLPKQEQISMWYKLEKPMKKNMGFGVRIGKKEEEITLKNEYYNIIFKIKPYLELKQFETLYGENIIKSSKDSKIFVVKIDNNEKLIQAKDFQIKDIIIEKERTTLILTLDEYLLEAKLTLELKRNNPEFIWNLEFRNKGTKDIKLKVCFPHLGGITLSELEKENWYLYPLYGGFISNKNVMFSLIYGAEECWWQMIDIFSPEKGYGILMRSTDTEGKYKNIFLTKGMYPEIKRVRTDEKRNPTEYVWHEVEELFKDSEYINIGFGYQMYILKPKENYKIDDVIIEVHEDDWHKAMEKYSQWAHNVWKWIGPKKLKDVYHYFTLHPFYDYDKHEKIFYSEWEKYKDKVDMIEIGLWWNPSKEGPWGIPVKEIMENPKYETLKKRLPYAWEKDPETGEWVYNLNRGDYEYRKAWGGLEPFRKYIEDIKKKGIITALYTDYNLVISSSETGKKYGEKYGIINPISEKDKKKLAGVFYLEEAPKEYVADLEYNMCCDNDFWAEYFSSIIERIVRDTKIDSVRLDELGYAGNRKPNSCWSDKHTHIFAKYLGEDIGFQGQSFLAKKVREKIDRINKDTILTAEFVGNDYLASNLDGALCYYIRRCLLPGYFGVGIKSIPVNLFRFYFPECKQIEWSSSVSNDLKERKLIKELSFFNGMAIGGTLGKHPWKVDPSLYFYDDRKFEILKENSDAFNGNILKPLIPTLKKDIYANLFSDGIKEIITIFNSTGYTQEVIFEVDDEPDFHYVDLINMEELKVLKQGDKNIVKIKKVRNEETACIGKFPKRIEIKEIEGKINLEIKDFKKDKKTKLIFIDVNDKKVLSEEIEQKNKTYEFKEKIKLIKLFEDGYLKDIKFLSRGN